LVPLDPLQQDGQMDIRLRSRDGREIEACISSRCVQPSQGLPSERVLMILDVTERKRAQAEIELARDLAQSASRSKTEFLAHMSHELRTPMNIIFGMTEMAMDASTSSDQRALLAKTRGAAQDLLVLVDEVLDLSRIEAGRMRFHAQKLVVRDWLAHVVEPLSTLASRKGLDLSWKVAPEVPERVIADPDRLRQVLVNLVDNAIKFTEQGHVRISVERASGAEGSTELEFVVEDSGVGIPPSEHARIFDPFVRVENGHASSPGTGLGLTISSRLVYLMGGRMWVDGGDCSGSRFHFTTTGAAPHQA
jgi:signal transduction histidine kinase